MRSLARLFQVVFSFVIKRRRCVFISAIKMSPAITVLPFPKTHPHICTTQNFWQLPVVILSVVAHFSFTSWLTVKSRKLLLISCFKSFAGSRAKIGVQVSQTSLQIRTRRYKVAELHKAKYLCHHRTRSKTRSKTSYDSTSTYNNWLFTSPFEGYSHQCPCKKRLVLASSAYAYTSFLMVSRFFVFQATNLQHRE